MTTSIFGASSSDVVMDAPEKREYEIETGSTVVEAVQKEEDLQVEKSREDVEREQEAILMAKYPGLCGHGKSKIVQRSLSGKGPKYFDSGDYAMALAKGGVLAKSAGSVPAPDEPIPSVSTVAPDNMPAVSSMQPTSPSEPPSLDNPLLLQKRRSLLQQQHSITGDLIPTPENVPLKKAGLPLKRQMTIS